MRNVNHVTLTVIIDNPGQYATRAGETITVKTISKGFASGNYSNGIADKWDVSGRLYPHILSKNDIVSK